MTTTVLNCVMLFHVIRGKTEKSTDSLRVNSHIYTYRTITNTNRKRQIEIYIYTNKQTNKQETKKQIKQKYIFIYLS